MHRAAAAAAAARAGGAQQPQASSTSSARFARRFVGASRRRNYNNQSALRKRQVAEQQQHAMVEAAAAGTAAAAAKDAAPAEQFVTEQKYVRARAARMTLISPVARVGSARLSPAPGRRVRAGLLTTAHLAIESRAAGSRCPPGASSGSSWTWWSTGTR